MSRFKSHEGECFFKKNEVKLLKTNCEQNRVKRERKI